MSPISYHPKENNQQHLYFQNAHLEFLYFFGFLNQILLLSGHHLQKQVSNCPM